MISKGMTAMTALSKFLVLLAIFLSASLGDAFLNHAQLDHLIRFMEPMSKPTNEPTVKPTKRTELPNILTSK